MRNTTIKTLALATVAALVTGCSGGGSSVLSPHSATPGGQGSSTNAKQKVSVVIHIPAKSSASKSLGTRKPNFVSPDTEFVSVSTYVANPATSTMNTNGSLFDTVTSDVEAPGLNVPSSTCVFDNTQNASGQGPRTCTILIDAPAGNDYFFFQTYDGTYNTARTRAVAAAVPGALLGEATTPVQTISANAANTVSATIGGVVSSFEFTSATNATFDQAFNQTFSFGVSAFDAAGDLIIAGTSDRYANPIAVSAQMVFGEGTIKVSASAKKRQDASTEPSSDATAAISVTAGPAGAVESSGAGSVINYSTDTVQVVYTSYADPGESADVQLTGMTTDGVTTTVFGANGISFSASNLSAASTGSAAPTFVAGAAGVPSEITFATAGESATVTLAEDPTRFPNAPAVSFTPSLSSTTCTSGTTVTAVASSTTSFNITENGTTTGSPCVVTFTDEYNDTATLDLNISSASGTGVTVPSSGSGTAATQFFVTGSQTNGYSTANYALDETFAVDTTNGNDSSYSVAADSGAGRVYVGQTSSPNIYVYAPNGSASTELGSFAPANGGVYLRLAVDSANHLLFTTNENGSNTVDVYSTSDIASYLSNSSFLLTPKTVITPTHGPYSLAVDSANKKLYIGERGNNVIEVFNEGSYGTPSYTYTGISGIGSITVDSTDNVLYVVNDTGNGTIETFNTLSPQSGVTGTISPPSNENFQYGEVAVDPVSKLLYITEPNNQTTVVKNLASPYANAETLSTGLTSYSISLF